MTTFILDALPKDMYSTTKLETMRDPDLELEQIISMVKRSLKIIRSGRYFRKGVKSRIVKFRIAVESQECVIMCVNPL